MLGRFLFRLVIALAVFFLLYIAGAMLQSYGLYTLLEALGLPAEQVVAVVYFLLGAGLVAFVVWGPDD